MTQTSSGTPNIPLVYTSTFWNKNAEYNNYREKLTNTEIYHPAPMHTRLQEISMSGLLQLAKRESINNNLIKSFSGSARKILNLVNNLSGTKQKKTLTS